MIKLFTGIDALRQHVHMESRIHGIITHGGEAANVVPKYARAVFYVRAAGRDYLEELVEKVRDVARGAALMTGCELKITEQQHLLRHAPQLHARRDLPEPTCRRSGWSSRTAARGAACTRPTSATSATPCRR